MGETMAVEMLLSAGLVAAIDQSSKWLVTHRLNGERFFSPGPLVRIRHVTNAGSTLRLAQNRALLLLLWGFAVFSIITFVWYGLFFHTFAAQVGLGVALGGATSNLIDRLLHGRVVDFIDVGFWPVFNIADMAIVLGLAVAFLSLY